MDKSNNIFQQLKEISGDIKFNMHMLDEIVPVEEQMKYFEYSKYVKSQQVNQSIDRNYMIAKLFSPDVDIEDKRFYLSSLATYIDVASFRAIETYHKCPLDIELTNWSALALAESKLALNAELSGEKQFFVSTGLGGKDGMLRYFCILAKKDRSEFAKLERKILEDELIFSFEKDNILIECLDFKSNYLKLFILCDLNKDPYDKIESVIKECNEVGDFIDQKFLLTNVKIIADDEIVKVLGE